VVKVLAGMKTRRSVKRIVFPPVPTEDGLKACAETGILPAFQRAAVDMRTKYERAVAR
jgi:hypothetical protein